MIAIKLILLSVAASVADSHFLPIKEDPADALVDQMIKGAGIESADSTLGSVTNWRKPTSQDEPEKTQTNHNRFNQHDLVKLQPIVDVTGLVAPNEWKSTPETDVLSSPPAQNEPVQSVLANADRKLIDESNRELLHEMVYKHTSHIESLDLDDSQKSTANTVDQELQNLKPKETIKVFDRDTSVPEPAGKTAARGLAHLGKSLEKYGPVEEKPVDPNFSYHHGHYRPTDAPTVPPPAPQQDAENDQKNVVVAVTSETSKNEATGPSVMQSVHRSKKRNGLRFPIRPEDIHQGAEHVESKTSKATSPSESHLNASNTSSLNVPVKKQDRTPVAKLKGRRGKLSTGTGSGGDRLKNLFDANSFAGELDADDVDKVLRFMKVQPEWNWHPFDLNADGKLSRQEFMNAARVADRFKISKK